MVDMRNTRTTQTKDETMTMITEIDNTTNAGTTYVSLTTGSRDVMVSYDPSRYFPISVYTTKRLSAGRQFQTWDEAIAGYKTGTMKQAIRTAQDVA